MFYIRDNVKIILFYVKQRKGWRMSCDVGEVTERLENELPSLYLCHSSFSNPSVASPKSQLILQSFFRFSHITGSSLTSPGELPMIKANFGRPTPFLNAAVYMLYELKKKNSCH